MSGVGGPVAVLDANVLYSAPLRHLLIWLAVCECFHARWTTSIQEEWTRSLMRDRPDLDVARIARTRQLMETHIEEAMVTGHENLISSLALPDADDRHVLAAAIHCGATIIVTRNLVDFPAAALAPHGIIVVHPDTFVRSLFEANPDGVVEAARLHRADLKSPPRTPDQYADTLERQGMTATAMVLRLRAADI